MYRKMEPCKGFFCCEILPHGDKKKEVANSTKEYFRKTFHQSLQYFEEEKSWNCIKMDISHKTVWVGELKIELKLRLSGDSRPFCLLD